MSYLMAWDRSDSSGSTAEFWSRLAGFYPVTPTSGRYCHSVSEWCHNMTDRYPGNCEEVALCHLSLFTECHRGWRGNHRFIFCREKWRWGVLRCKWGLVFSNIRSDWPRCFLLCPQPHPIVACRLVCFLFLPFVMTELFPPKWSKCQSVAWELILWYGYMSWEDDIFIFCHLPKYTARAFNFSEPCSRAF